MIAGGVLAVGTVLYFFGRRIAGAAGDAARAIGNVNKGTPFEGAGPIGTLGHATDALTGGLLSRFGGKIGEGLFNLFNKPYDPNAPGTPVVYRRAAANSPVKPQDKVTLYARL